MNEPSPSSRQIGCFDFYRMLLAGLVADMLLHLNLGKPGLPMPVRYGLAFGFGIGVFVLLQSLSRWMIKAFQARFGDDLATGSLGGWLLVVDLLTSTALSVAIFAACASI